MNMIEMVSGALVSGGGAHPIHGTPIGKSSPRAMTKFNNLLQSPMMVNGNDQAANSFINPISSGINSGSNIVD